MKLNIRSGIMKVAGVFKNLKRMGPILYCSHKFTINVKFTGQHCREYGNTLQPCGDYK